MADLEAGSRYLRMSFKTNSKYKARFEIIMDHAKEIASQQRGTTINDLNHCLRVENNVGRLLSSRTKNIHPKTACLLSMASVLHDLAKIKPKEKWNKNHGREAKRVLTKNKGIIRIFFGDDIPLSRAVAFVIGPHDDGKVDEDTPETFMLYDPPDMRPRDLASLLRLADMIDTDIRRVPYTYFSLVSDTSSDWEKKLMVVRREIEGWALSADKRKILFQIRKGMRKERRAMIEEYTDNLRKAMTESQKRYLKPFISIYETRRGIPKEQEINFPTDFGIRLV